MSSGRQIRVGVGGWVFPPWRGVFYPPGLRQAKELAYASRQLTTIEIKQPLPAIDSRKPRIMFAARGRYQSEFAVDLAKRRGAVLYAIYVRTLRLIDVQPGKVPRIEDDRPLNSILVGVFAGPLGRNIWISMYQGQGYVAIGECHRRQKSVERPVAVISAGNGRSRSAGRQIARGTAVCERRR